MGAEVPRLSWTWEHPELTQRGTQVLVAGPQLMMCPPETGDILGNALQNVDRLLAMPYGCGEQNMVRFAPNIYIQQYLEKSGQLLPDIRAKAQGFLQSGQWDPDPGPGRDTTVPQPPPQCTWLPWAPLGTEIVPCALVLLQGTSGSCSTNTTTAPTAPLGRATATATPGEGSAAASGAPADTQGAPVLTLSPPVSPWLQADGVCAQVLRAGPSLRGHRGAAHHGRTAVAAAAPDEERLLPQRGQTLQQRPAGGAGAGLGTQWGLDSGGVPVLDPCPAVPSGRCLGRALTLGVRDGSDAGAGAAHAGEDGPFFPTGTGGVGTAAGTGDWPFQATLQPDLGTGGRTGQHWDL